VDGFYQTAIDALMADKNVDAVLLYIMVTDHPRTWSPDVDLLINTLQSKKTKPVVAWITGKGNIVKKTEEGLEENGSGIPSFPSPERAVRALGAVYKYHNYIKIKSSF
jgi:acyl-CoA synthetase (NDP forming)